METTRILIVEDDQTIAMGLEFALHQEGYAVTLCSRVNSARTALEQSQFQLAILDINLPDGDMPYGVAPPSSSVIALCSQSQYAALCQTLAPDDAYTPTLFVSVGDHYEAFDAWMKQNPLLSNSNNLDVFSVHQMMEETKRILLIVSIFCYGFITLMMLISITSVLNTISTNMQLRKKEFAMLQSVGMTRRAMGRMIRFESLFYGLKSLLYTLPVSLVLSGLIYRLFAQSYQFPFSLPWSSYLGAILGVFALVFITMWYATRKMRRQNIVDTIRQDSI